MVYITLAPGVNVTKLFNFVTDAIDKKLVLLSLTSLSCLTRKR
jgi:hypothetical protein